MASAEPSGVSSPTVTQRKPVGLAMSRVSAGGVSRIAADGPVNRPVTKATARSCQREGETLAPCCEPLPDAFDDERTNDAAAEAADPLKPISPNLRLSFDVRAGSEARFVAEEVLTIPSVAFQLV